MRRFLLALVVMSLSLAGAAQAEEQAQQACPFAGQRPMLVVRLFFGLGRAGGGTIADRRWRQFLAEEVTPRFPAGFTVYDGQGQWRDSRSQAVMREPSRVVELATGDSETARAGLEALMAAYRRRFDQQSVGIVSAQSCAAF